MLTERAMSLFIGSVSSVIPSLQCHVEIFTSSLIKRNMLGVPHPINTSSNGNSRDSQKKKMLLLGGSKLLSAFQALTVAFNFRVPLPKVESSHE